MKTGRMLRRMVIFRLFLIHFTSTTGFFPLTLESLVLILCLHVYFCYWFEFSMQILVFSGFENLYLKVLHIVQTEQGI